MAPETRPLDQRRNLRRVRVIVLPAQQQHRRRLLKQTVTRRSRNKPTNLSRSRVVIVDAGRHASSVAKRNNAEVEGVETCVHRTAFKSRESRLCRQYIFKKRLRAIKNSHFTDYLEMGLRKSFLQSCASCEAGLFVCFQLARCATFCTKNNIQGDLVCG